MAHTFKTVMVVQDSKSEDLFQTEEDLSETTNTYKRDSRLESRTENYKTFYK